MTVFIKVNPYKMILLRKINNNRNSNKLQSLIQVISNNNLTTPPVTLSIIIMLRINLKTIPQQIEENCMMN